MEFRPLASGYCFLEAPRVAGEYIWFTDLLLGGVYRLSPDGTVDHFLKDRHHIGGLAVNHDGRIVCGGPGGLVWLDPATGSSGTIIDSIDGGVARARRPVASEEGSVVKDVHLPAGLRPAARVSTSIWFGRDGDSFIAVAVAGHPDAARSALATVEAAYE